MELTEVIGHPLYSNRHIGLRRGMPPNLLEIALAPDDGEARAKGQVKTRGTDDRIDLEHISGVHLDAVGYESIDLADHHLHVVLAKSLEVSGCGCHTPGAEGKVGDKELAQAFVAAEHHGHVLPNLGAGEGLNGSIFNHLQARSEGACGQVTSEP